MRMDKDNKKYIYFNFTDIFDFKRGTRFTEEEHISGDVAYISSTKNNNGIFSYVNPPAKTKKGKKLIVYNNCLTLSNSGSVCYLFYHNYDFVASDHVTVIWIKNRPLTLKIALYLKTIFEKIKYKHNFGREISNNRLRKEKIKLPVDKYNNPDWQYMENYIKNLKSQIKFKPIYTKNNNNLKQIDMSKWGEFSFIDERLWTEIKRGERFVEKDRISGDIEYYSASQKNNSLTDRISNPLFVKTNCIVYNTFAFAFYVEGTFTASDEIQCFHNPKLNKYNALFITTIMNKSRYKYQFGRKAFLNKLSTETIKLPITQEGLPDWQYMENYIKSLPYGDLI